MKLFWKKIKYFLHWHLTLEDEARLAGVDIGENNMVSSRFWEPSEPYLIKIGNYCQITDNVKMYTHGGAGAVRHLNPRFDVFGKIVVGDYVYIGSNSMICPGVHIGNHVLIAAGSVVTKSVPNDLVVGGNPAKIICTIQEYYYKNDPFNLNTKGLSLKEKKKVLLQTPSNKFVNKENMK